MTSSPTPEASSLALPPIQISHDRIIRTMVGLRPFRPSGFVVRSEKLDDKTVIHNYGHGGSGITLSWGTGQLALEQAAGVDLCNCAVLGCGVIGLTMARLLQLRGHNPTIYAKELPPVLTSNIAGGLWEPVSLYDLPSVTPHFREQLDRAARFSFRRFQSFAGDEYGVEWMKIFFFSRTAPIQPVYPGGPLEHLEFLYPEGRHLNPHEHPFQMPFAYSKQSMRIETTTFLNALMRDFQIAGGRIVVRDFATKRDLAALPETVLFNCTGLGARSLFGDEEMTPIRGQIVVLLPQPEVRYVTQGPGDIYTVPRRDGIWLGGTFQRGNFSTEPDPADTDRIIAENRALFAGLRIAP